MDKSHARFLAQRWNVEGDFLFGVNSFQKSWEHSRVVLSLVIGDERDVKAVQWFLDQLFQNINMTMAAASQNDFFQNVAFLEY